jgi:hypothetical protein
MVGLAIVDLKGKPCLSGVLTCLLLYTPMIAGLVLILWLTGHFKWTNPWPAPMGCVAVANNPD